ncbi:MAG: 2-C-methyl-D-erythritol 4-phosphate cytidylyltransferase [Clostridia bacterium]|nr:2-C-methyl-D-erythritol 4-phosphate cytidylyltransferase [Clostridia bacterium]
MVFAAVLAGGVGNRMGANTPKQYLKVGGEPILSRSVEKFVRDPVFEHVVVLTPEDWTQYTRDLLAESLGETDRLTILAGGETRNDTLTIALRYLEHTYGLTEDTILVTHDAVRPFVTRRILAENIAAARRVGACGTAIPATDTILVSGDGEHIERIPDRSELYQMQTPQSFQAKKLLRLMESLTESEKKTLTDGCKIFTLKGEPVALVEGEVFNIKITYPFDLKVGETIAAAGLDEPETERSHS